MAAQILAINFAQNTAIYSVSAGLYQVNTRWFQVVSMASIVSEEGNMTPGKVKEHFGQQMGSLLSPEYWCNSQFVAKFMAQIWVAINLAQEHKWPIPLTSLLTQGLTPPYYISPVARDRSSGEIWEVTQKKWQVVQQDAAPRGGLLIYRWKSPKNKLEGSWIILLDSQTDALAFYHKY